MRIAIFINFLLFKSSKLIFIFTIFATQMTISYLFLFIAEIIGQENAFNGADFSKLNTTEIFVITVIIAPIIETLVFQYGAIKISRKIVKNIHFQAFISASLFAISHCYNFLYAMNILAAGLVFGYAFIISEQRKYYPFWIIFFIHSLYNFHVFLIRTFL
ncbi:CPBP family glutamic-type intramembrane protease [Runella sp.]|uniref:CPBP family glutamic-type intramembrane protease n=1 Tax=Runella sp. TaxID=1960881 RepID=UPI003D138B5D